MQEEHDHVVRSGAASHLAPLVPEEFEVPATAAITVMVASNRRHLRAAWRSALACAPGIDIKGEAVMDAACVATCVEHYRPNVLLLDKALLDELDPQSLRRIQEQCPQVRVLLLWDEICHGLVVDVLRNRFHGFLPTTCRPEVSLKAIRAVSQGELWLSRAALAMVVAGLPGLSGLPDSGDAGASADADRDSPETLTPREQQVVALLRKGCINKEIARELGIMEDTVKKHLQSVFAKLGVHRRALVALRPLPAYRATHSLP